MYIVFSNVPPLGFFKRSVKRDIGWSISHDDIRKLRLDVDNKFTGSAFVPGQILIGGRITQRRRRPEECCAGKYYTGAV